MLLSSYIDKLNQLYGEVGDVDVRFTGLHNTYSPDVMVITTKSPKQEGDGQPMKIILTGHPINAWPLPEMKMAPDVTCDL